MALDRSEFTVAVPAAWARLLALSEAECASREQPKPRRQIECGEYAVYPDENRIVYGANGDHPTGHPGVQVGLTRQRGGRGAYEIHVFFVETMVAWDIKRLPAVVEAGNGMQNERWRLLIRVAEEPIPMTPTADAWQPGTCASCGYEGALVKPYNADRMNESDGQNTWSLCRFCSHTHISQIAKYNYEGNLLARSVAWIANDIVRELRAATQRNP